MSVSQNPKEKVNVRSKELVAKLLATENINIIHKNDIDTAYFDTKNRILVLPSLESMSNTTYMGYISHEVGHALYSPSEVEKCITNISKRVNKTTDQEKMFVKNVYNLVEDARIEKMMKRKFPGLISTFSSFYKELFDTHEKFKEIVEYVKNDNTKETFLDRLNGEFKLGGFQKFNFNKEEMDFVERVREVETEDDVANMVCNIMQYVETPPEQPNNNQSESSKKSNDNKDSDNEGNSSSNKEDKNDESEENASDKSSNDNKDSNSSKGESSGNSEEENDENGEENPEKSSNDSDNDNSEEENKEENENQSSSSQSPGKYEQGSIQAAINNAQQDAIKLSKNGPGVETVYIPDVDLESVLVPYKNAYAGLKSSYEDFNKYSNFIKANKKSIMHMVQEFEQRKAAEEYKRTRTSVSGSLDMKKISKYKISDDVFKKNEVVKEGKNHGLIMIIDWSGSMSGERVIGAVKQSLILADFCRKTNIKFEIFIFTSSGNVKASSNPFEYILSSFSLVNVLSSRMGAVEYRESCSTLLSIAESPYKSGANRYFSMGGTPLNDTIVSLFNLIPKFKKENKLDKVHTILLTDGASYPLYQKRDERNRGISLKNNRGTAVYTTHKSTGKTNKTIFGDGKPHFFEGFGTMQTRSLLDLLQYACECNAIGFFIADNNVPSELSSSGLQKNIDEYKKNRYTILENEGYKKLYVMSTELIKSNVAHSGNAISDLQANRKSKIILTEFIKEIA